MYISQQNNVASLQFFVPIAGPVQWIFINLFLSAYTNVENYRFFDRIPWLTYTMISSEIRWSKYFAKWHNETRIEDKEIFAVMK